jgi:hypothetical protein
MNIHEIKEKIKSERVGELIVLISLILLVGIIAFGLGRLSVLPEHKDIPYVNIMTPDAKLVNCSV